MPSPSPARFPSGVTTDPIWGPLAQMGLPNPLFYHCFWDDFDITVASMWNRSTTNGGTAVNTPGDGGRLLFTTGIVSGNFEEIQLTSGGYTFTAGKKQFFLTRVQLADVLNTSLLAGLANTNSSPFTLTTDGLYFFHASGAADNLVLRHSLASVNTDIIIPTTAYTLANATDIDLGFYVDRMQDIYAFVGSQLVGYFPQSGTGPVSSSGVSILPVKGPVVGNDQQVRPLVFPAGILNITLAIASGSAGAKTMTTDFILASKER